jgi:hypothetical protein
MTNPDLDKNPTDASAGRIRAKHRPVKNARGLEVSGPLALLKRAACLGSSLLPSRSLPLHRFRQLSLTCVCDSGLILRRRKHLIPTAIYGWPSIVRRFARH